MKKNYFKTSLLVFSLLVTGVAQGQEKKLSPPLVDNLVEYNAAQKSAPLTTDLFKEITHSESADKWAISVKPTFSRRHYSQDIIDIKESKIQDKINSYNENISEEPQESVAAVNPTIGKNFEANWTLIGTPPDNNVAISNGGYIVTVNNDGLEYYNASGSFLYFDYWSDFFNDNTLTATIYDPKVIYDSGSDRFVIVVLHGTTSSTSKVMVCFSKSNNPQQGWWIYKLTGNPLNNNCWFDYPALGVSNNEIYVTGNLFVTNGSFNQSVIYQIPKAAGYAGNTINWQYWSNLSSTPYKAFTLFPASYGHQGNYGPGIYFVSNNSGGDNRIRLWDLTDDMSGNPELNSYTVNTTSYSLASDAYQLGTNDKLDNGDCRVQNAFYLNGIVHYVFHSDIGSGWNGINYNRLTVSNLTNQSSKFGLQGRFDYSYPAVVPFSTSISDKSVMIAFLCSSSSIYPQVRVVNCDNNMQWSPSTLVKAGETYVDILNGDERWGDFTGISRRHNSGTPRIWLAGCYGANIVSQNASNTFKTYVAEVYGTSGVGVNDIPTTKTISMFPNPTYQLINIFFTSESFEKTTIKILDINGRVVKVLYSDIPKKGENRLTFNKGALTAGTYFVNISTSSKTIKNEKLVILD
ncbi:MAG: T9SS type A sorting domain-containing protein [Bacteroidales bacterium]|jgi:hypothetical protein